MVATVTEQPYQFNFRELTDTQTNELEHAIANKLIPVSDPREPSVSVQYYHIGNAMYKQMNQPNTPINSYDIYASNGMGYTCYALYKSMTGQIYVIHVSMNDIANVYEINSDKFRYLF